MGIMLILVSLLIPYGAEFETNHVTENEIEKRIYDGGGDNFYYATWERMKEALDFWLTAYENGWFVRLAIVDKAVSKVIGTIAQCLRVSKAAFENMGILRVDVKSDCETEDTLFGIFLPITPHMSALLGCKGIITKAPIYAVERINAIQKLALSNRKII